MVLGVVLVCGSEERSATRPLSLPHDLPTIVLGQVDRSFYRQYWCVVVWRVGQPGHYTCFTTHHHCLFHANIWLRVKREVKGALGGGRGVDNGRGRTTVIVGVRVWS